MNFLVPTDNFTPRGGQQQGDWETQLHMRIRSRLDGYDFLSQQFVLDSYLVTSIKRTATKRVENPA